jgi:hypothetical protein
MSNYEIFQNNIGECVSSIFKNTEEYKNKVVPLAAVYMSIQDYMSVLNKHLAPNKFIYNDMPAEQFEKLPFPGAFDLARMFEFFQTEKMFRDIELTEKLNTKRLDFDAWVLENRESLLNKLH